MSANQGLVDGISAARGAAERSADTAALALVVHAKHLRWEHGMSRRKVAERLGVRERWVRDNVDVSGRSGQCR